MLLGLLLVVAQGVGAAQNQAVPCADGEDPVLVFATPEGAITIQLDPAAAPTAVKRVVSLARGPVFNPELSEGSPFATSAGYYDGLDFDRALRGVELALSPREPRQELVIETEIDGVALGLDQVRIDDTAKADLLWQQKLYPRIRDARTEDQRHPLMEPWMKAWGASSNADFLVGVSQLDINEVLGYRYRTGLRSLPVTRGAVTTIPLSPRWSTPGLSIALADRPDLTGTRMVIGHVVEGLEIAETAASRPLTPVKTTRDRLLVPLQVSVATIECRSAADGPPSAG